MLNADLPATAPRPTRRQTLCYAGMAAALVATAAAEATDTGDAGLIALCAECVQLEGVLSHLCPADHEHDPKHKAAEDAANARQQALMLEIATIPASTPAGLAAKGRAVRAFYKLNPPEDECAAGAVLWSLVCDAAGRPV